MTNKDNHKQESIVLGAGCFWCVEAMLKDLNGIHSIEPGYAAGYTSQPTYKEVCSGKTGHAEVVKVVYDPNIIPLEDILRVFFLIHNPTTLNAQGADIGTQYRSTIVVENESQKEIANIIKNEVDKAAIWDRPIVTKIEQLNKFYPAEQEHINYFELHPEAGYCQAIIAPKVLKVRKEFSKFLKK